MSRIPYYHRCCRAIVSSGCLLTVEHIAADLYGRQGVIFTASAIAGRFHRCLSSCNLLDCRHCRCHELLLYHTRSFYRSQSCCHRLSLIADAAITSALISTFMFARLYSDITGTSLVGGFGCNLESSCSQLQRYIQQLAFMQPAIAMNTVIEENSIIRAVFGSQCHRKV